MSPKKTRSNVYQICIKILKAKHLPQNANPMVVVKVGNRRKKTVVRERTDSPIYNEVKLENVVLTKLLSISSVKLFNCYSISCSIFFAT